MENIAGIIKENNLENLRDTTEWVFVPSLEDPGQVKMFPAMPYPDYLIAPLIQAKFKNVSVSPNPARISFLGKEIVLCRYNYLKKIKQNHIPKINFV